MDEIVIPDDNGKGLTLGFIGTDVEFVNPIEYYAERDQKPPTPCVSPYIHYLALLLSTPFSFFHQPHNVVLFPRV